jgi:gamma-glutamyl:cysteine ligase YbdK (ATP-grasp superfamily)
MNMHRYHLFQVIGVELEYMITTQKEGKVAPLADQLLKAACGAFDDFENGKITWSNELVNHVIELKCTQPEADLLALRDDFVANVREANRWLATLGARLMPGAAHPTMWPEAEAMLWPHGYSEVYTLYDRLFNCKGHGWSNVQSTHINLPFYDDEEFARLHAAVRIILPLIPAMAASSPMLEGKLTGWKDARLKYYKQNQTAIPVIVGMIIPERVYSRRNYIHRIYDPIRQALAPHDPEKILDPVWVNSRGAIARFDRGSIEIRLMDIQECPTADLALVAFWLALVRWLTAERPASTEVQQHFSTDVLAHLLDKTMVMGENARIDSAEYLALWGLEGDKWTASRLLKHIFERLMKEGFSEDLDPWKLTIEHILQSGTLATRLQKALGTAPSAQRINEVYARLCENLETDTLFSP